MRISARADYALHGGYWLAQPARRADLGDLPVLEQHDAVGELHRLLLVVRDEHGGDRDPLVRLPTKPVGKPGNRGQVSQ